MTLYCANTHDYMTNVATYRLQVIIVNFRSPDLVVNCLRSLSCYFENKTRFLVFVVDNNSRDGSVDKLNAAILANDWYWVRVISSDINGGFAHGNNQALKLATDDRLQFDFVFFLNPDTVVTPGAIDVLINFIVKSPEIGIVGSSLVNAGGSTECSAHNFPSCLGELDSGARLGFLSRLLERYVVSPALREDAHACDWVSGASMLVRREVFDQVGLMDEGFFLYFEEVDFCHRAKKMAWECWYVPDSRVVHLEGASTGITLENRRRPSYWYDSRRRYFVKHYGIGALFLADLLWVVGRLSLWLRFILGGASKSIKQDPKWYGFDLLWGDLWSLITGNVFNIPRERKVHEIRRS
jgi:N-acetylglucosaminyl-diphospho-decaprenol L-rhamnosyltransferase